MSVVVVFFVLLVNLFGCSHNPAITFGIQEKHASFVPARTAVLPCRIWPTGARYKDLPLSNNDEKSLEQVCTEINKFVIQGFSGQPYMRGLSPRAVAKALEAAGSPNLMDQLDGLWDHRAEDCAECTIAPAFYMSSIATRPKWQKWLTDFSKAAHNADAALIPFVTFLSMTQSKNRGVHTKALNGGLVLLLIDTNNGSLLWSGGRRASSTSKSLIANDTPEPQEPSRDVLMERLLTADVWHEYPGRQNYH